MGHAYNSHSHECTNPFTDTSNLEKSTLTELNGTVVLTGQG